LVKGTDVRKKGTIKVINVADRLNNTLTNSLPKEGRAVTESPPASRHHKRNTSDIVASNYQTKKSIP
jgi:Holliday junction resolvase